MDWDAILGADEKDLSKEGWRVVIVGLRRDLRRSRRDVLWLLVLESGYI